ncbi:MAG: endonuclease domain-containing protein [Acidobacteria bacterium]|nr:endonuclease domain-containing protein [Acidobacteriota bacterium]
MNYNKRLIPRAKELRKNMTIAERRLWSKIRSKSVKGVRFYRQKIIGNYIVDFYCHKAKLAIELDGSQHYFGNKKKKDFVRDHYLNSLGIKVLRFSDSDVLKNIDGVLQRIWENV